MTDFDPETTELRDACLRSLHTEHADSGDPLERLLLAARLAALGDEAVFGDWPSDLRSRFGEAASGDLVAKIRDACLALIPRLRSGSGSELASALRTAQSLQSLLEADRAHGGLLEPAHAIIEAMGLDCDGLPLDDEAAAELAECPELRSQRTAWLIPLLAAPVGATASAALAHARRALGPVPVRQVRAVEALEAELVFDGGRPSQRMIERFAARRGTMVFEDETTAEVRAILEPDWQVKIQFAGDPERLQRIDRVRLGTRAAEPLDEDRDFWRASLAELGVNAQTLLVNQPIMVQMRDGVRFSL